MPYPLGNKHVIDIELSNLADPLSELQERATQRTHSQLLKVLWSDTLGEPDQIFDAIATFHKWLPTNTPKDSSYVLHFLPTARQQGKLHQFLLDVRAIATVWQHNGLVLQGASSPIHQQLFTLIANSPRLIAEEIAGVLANEYAKGYVKNELSYLTHQRAVARKRLIFRIPELSLGITSRNRWHYFPLWQPNNQ
jgi:hypothetical protein